MRGRKRRERERERKKERQEGSLEKQVIRNRFFRRKSHLSRVLELTVKVSTVESMHLVSKRKRGWRERERREKKGKGEVRNKVRNAGMDLRSRHLILSLKPVTHDHKTRTTEGERE